MSLMGGAGLAEDGGRDVDDASPPASNMSGMMAWRQRNGPFRFTCINSSQISSVRSSNWQKGDRAALLTRIETLAERAGECAFNRRGYIRCPSQNSRRKRWPYHRGPEPWAHSPRPLQIEVPDGYGNAIAASLRRSPDPDLVRHP